MSGVNLLGTIGLIVAGTLPFAAVQAQTSGAADAETRASITVLAPRVRETNRTGSIFPEQIISTQSVVYIDDLDLTTASGRDELNDRIELAAKESCEWLDELYPLSTPDADQCQREAVARAEDDVEAAIAAAAM